MLHRAMVLLHASHGYLGCKTGSLTHRPPVWSSAGAGLLRDPPASGPAARPGGRPAPAGPAQ